MSRTPNANRKSKSRPAPGGGGRRSKEQGYEGAEVEDVTGRGRTEGANVPEQTQGAVEQGKPKSREGAGFRGSRRGERDTVLGRVHN